ncbi:F-box protein At3g07870-like [Cornus florida]|uniref:F-box protein At3g07870-like n=1 Tax=Cornus florida TaxID=4283 RepID=UPI0028963BA0|nr:F-box protein At3g07870-like [Cornus florida]
MGRYPNGVKRKSDIRVTPKDRNFKIVNSCNGFLWLSEPTSNEPVVVCNPITGEYINLPVGKGRPSKKTQYFVDCGFGFSPRTNQYKVIRMFERQFAARARGGARMSCCTPETGWINYSSGIEICTLGEGSWKSIGDAPFLYCNLTFPTYLEGCVHWLLYQEFRGHSRTLNIVCFSFDKEQFKLFSSPRQYQKCYANYIVDLGVVHNVSMGVLDGCLCICDANYDPIYIWVMKKYGVGKSWTKMFSIRNQPDQSWPYGLYQPINYLKNGEVLLFHYDTCALICYDP